MEITKSMIIIVTIYTLAVAFISIMLYRYILAKKEKKNENLFQGEYWQNFKREYEEKHNL